MISVCDELSSRPEQTAEDQDSGRQKAHAVPGAAFGRLLDTAGRVDFAADEIDDPEHGRDHGAPVAAEEIKAGHEGDEHFQGILLDAKMPFKKLVAGNGRGGPPPARARPAGPEWGSAA